MNKVIAIFLSFTFLFAASFSSAQVKKYGNASQASSSATSRHFETGNASLQADAKNSIPFEHLSPQIVVNGADPLPISSRYDIGSNGKSMHNLVTDPDDPQKLHFIAM